METRPATQQDLLTLWPRLARRMTDEYKLAGFTPGKARGLFRDWIKAGSADAIIAGGEVVAIMAWTMQQGSMMTSFAGTEEFFQPRLVRPFRRYIRELQADHGNCFLVSNSYSEHPQVAKWFETLGFEIDTEEGVHRVFVLNPR